MLLSFVLHGHNDSGENVQGVRDAATDISCEVSRRDIATQVSPDGSIASTSSRRSFGESSPSALPIVELHHLQSSKTEVRDVQVDEMVTVKRGSKKNKIKINQKQSEVSNDWKKKDDLSVSAADVSETTKSMSRYVHSTTTLYVSFNVLDPRCFKISKYKEYKQ